MGLGRALRPALGVRGAWPRCSPSGRSPRPGASPCEHPTVSRRLGGAVALNDWGGSASSRSADVDAYAYPAAYAATRALLADLEGEELAAVVGAGLRGERAYDPAGTKDSDGGRTSWSRWLDLLETRGGVTDARRGLQPLGR